MPGGGLWIEKVGKQLSIHSPMLIPGAGRATLYVQKVSHRQDNNSGTTTIVELVKVLNPGGGNDVSGGPSLSPDTPAKSLPDDLGSPEANTP